MTPARFEHLAHFALGLAAGLMLCLTADLLGWLGRLAAWLSDGWWSRLVIPACVVVAGAALWEVWRDWRKLG